MGIIEALFWVFFWIGLVTFFSAVMMLTMGYINLLLDNELTVRCQAAAEEKRGTENKEPDAEKESDSHYGSHKYRRFH